MKITTDGAREAVEIIRSERSDDESAHADEDALRENVLTAVAYAVEDGRTLAELVELANIALSTAEISFNRWYA